MPTTDEYVTINGVILALEGAWQLPDPTPLLALGPARGANLVQGHEHGEQFQPKERGPLRVVMELSVYGEQDQNGLAHPDFRSGTRDNIAYLNAQLHVANVGLVAAVYTFADGATRSGDVEVRDLAYATRSEIGNVTTCALDIVVPAGQLVAP